METSSVHIRNAVHVASPYRAEQSVAAPPSGTPIADQVFTSGASAAEEKATAAPLSAKSLLGKGSLVALMLVGGIAAFPGVAAAQHSHGSAAAPHYSAPAPHYSAPAQHSSGSSNSGQRSSGSYSGQRSSGSYGGQRSTGTWGGGTQRGTTGTTQGRGWGGGSTGTTQQRGGWGGAQTGTQNRGTWGTQQARPGADGRYGQVHGAPSTAISSGNRTYNVPRGGWVTSAHQQFPDMHTTIINRNTVVERNSVVNVHERFGREWGGDFDHRGHFGYYSGNSFWLGFDIGMMVGNPCWPYGNCGYGYPMAYPQPIYIFSPVSQVAYETPIPVPQNGFDSKEQAQVAVLSAMAQPQRDDPSAGLYAPNPYDQEAPGERLSGPGAFNRLAHGRAVFFHPTNGANEKLEDLGDVNAYVYAQENQSQAPAQQVPQ